MAHTYTVIENENLGSVRGIVFKVVGTTSVSALTPEDLGLIELFGVTPLAGDGLLLWAGASQASTGNLTLYSGVTASSGTLYGLAIGK